MNSPTTVYIMRILWRNYNSPWEDGMAFFNKEQCYEAARQELEANYKPTVEQHKLHNAEMIFEEGQFSIGVYARRVGKEDLWLGEAEIHEVPIYKNEE